MKNRVPLFYRYFLVICAVLLCGASSEIYAQAKESWTRIDDSDTARILYTGGWVQAQEDGLFGGSSHQTNEIGYTASFSFEGTGVQWIGQKDTNYTKAKVYLDGRLIGMPNANGPASKQQVIYSLVNIPDGEHTFKIESVGPPAASDQNFIEIDAFSYTAASDWQNTADRMELSLSSNHILPGETCEAAVSLTDSKDSSNAIYYTASEITFETTDKSIAEISDEGVVTARKKGKTQIKASAGDLSVTAELTVGGEPGEQAELRKVINNENPVMMLACYGVSPDSDRMENGDTLLGRWQSVPEDIRGNVVMQIHPGGISGADNVKRFYEKQLNIAKENNIPVALVVITGGDGKGLDSGWAESVLQTYDNLVGLVTAENYYSWEGQIPRITSYLNIAAQYGAYVMCFEQWDNTYLKLAQNSGFMEAAKRYKDNLILSFKTTSSHETVSSNSYIQGMWLTDIYGQWGGLIDSWFWNERAYWKLFGTPLGDWKNWGDVVNYYGGEEARTAVTEPEAMIGMQMLNIYLNGGCVYNFEHPNYTSGIKNQTTPLFNNVICQVFRNALEKLALSKEEIQKKTKVVYSGRVSDVQNLFEGLISRDDRSPLYTSGRYGILPVLPGEISEDTIHTAMPGAVILTKDSRELADEQSRIEFFNQQYPEEYQGDGYAVKQNEEWYFYNSHDNQNVNETIILGDGSSSEPKITMEPHTYGILSEKENSWNLYLNNFRVNKDDIWSGYKEVHNPDGTTKVQKPDDQWNDSNPQMNVWLENTYMKIQPADLDMRITQVELSDLPSRPEVTVTEGMEWMTAGQPEVAYNDKTGKAVLTVRCNGPVNLEIRTEPLDRTQMDKLLAEASKIELDMKDGKYTSSGQEDFKKCLKEARETMNAPVITQELLDRAAQALQKTISALKQRISVSELEFTKIADQRYDGREKTPQITLKKGGYTLQRGVDFTADYTYNVNAGTAWVTINGKGDYLGSMRRSFTILPISIVKAAVSGIPNQIYNGKTLKPQAVLKIGTTRLKLNRDYTISYKNNKNTGKATALFKGTGNYTGQRTVNFLIVPKKVIVKSAVSTVKGQIKVSWKRDTKASGYQVVYSTNKSFKGKTKTISAGKNKTTQIKISRLVKGKKYYVKVRSYKLAGNKKIYGAYSVVKPVSVKK